MSPDVSKADLKIKLCIGEVYFASPDTVFKPILLTAYIKTRTVANDEGVIDWGGKNYGVKKAHID